MNKQKIPTFICLYCICSHSCSLNISWLSFFENVLLPCSSHSALHYLYHYSSRTSFSRPVICFIIYLWIWSSLAISVQSRREFNEPAPQQHETGTMPSLLQLKVWTVVKTKPHHHLPPGITIFSMLFSLFLLYNSLHCLPLSPLN